MSDYSDFITAIKDHHNREDWSDTLVAFYISTADEKLNSELRVSRMIRSATNVVKERCAPLPDDWLENDLVLIEAENAPGGWVPIRYKARDEFFNLPDKWALSHYTIQGRSMFFGGAPDDVEGTQFKLHYYANVPVFADDCDSWVYTFYPSLYLSAASIQAYLHAVGEEEKAIGAKQLTEDKINKLNDEWRLAKASGSRMTRTRTRSFG